MRNISEFPGWKWSQAQGDLVTFPPSHPHPTQQTWPFPHFSYFIKAFLGTSAPAPHLSDKKGRPSPPDKIGETLRCCQSSRKMLGCLPQLSQGAYENGRSPTSQILMRDVGMQLRQRYPCPAPPGDPDPGNYCFGSTPPSFLQIGRLRPGGVICPWTPCRSGSRTQVPCLRP